MTNIKLEERVCACGCQRRFKALPQSAAKYSSHFCMEAAGVPPAAPSMGLARGKGRPAKIQEKELSGSGEIEDRPGVDPAA